MAEKFDMILKGATIVNQDGRSQRDIAVQDGKIAAIEDLSQSSAEEIIECRGLHILPGMIDSQVHFREPGAEHKEDLETGSRAAVLGGITSVFEMPNTRPLTVCADSLADKVKRAHHRMHCDFAFWVGGTRENIADIPILEKLPGAAGIKVFMGSSTGDLLVDDDASVGAILKNASRRVAFHSEEEARLKERQHLRVESDPSSHPIWRDEIAALTCTERLVRLAREAKARIHILHISTAEEIEFLQAHKDIATLEATPHHLTLTSQDYARLGTLIQMNPPIREKRHRAMLWKGVQQGLIDVLGSDHAPHTLEEKAKPYPQSPSGMTGVQTSSAIMLNHVAEGRLSLERLVDLTSHSVQRIFGISCKGRIALGYDADFTIVDLKRQEVIKAEQMGSRSNWTPYEDMRVTGWPVGTIIRGKRVMWQGEILNPHQGEAVRFHAAL